MAELTKDLFDDDFPDLGAADDKKSTNDNREKSPKIEKKETSSSADKSSKANKNNETQRQG